MPGQLKGWPFEMPVPGLGATTTDAMEWARVRREVKRLREEKEGETSTFRKVDGMRRPL